MLNKELLWLGPNLSGSRNYLSRISSTRDSLFFSSTSQVTFLKTQVSSKNNLPLTAGRKRRVCLFFFWFTRPWTLLNSNKSFGVTPTTQRGITTRRIWKWSRPLSDTTSRTFSTQLQSIIQDLSRSLSWCLSRAHARALSCALFGAHAPQLSRHAFYDVFRSTLKLLKIAKDLHTRSKYWSARARARVWNKWTKREKER